MKHLALTSKTVAKRILRTTSTIAVPSRHFARHESVAPPLPSTLPLSSMKSHTSPLQMRQERLMSSVSNKSKESHSRVLEGTRTSNRGDVRVGLIETPYREHMTLYTNLLDRAKIDDGTRKMFGTRKVDPATGQAGEYEWITYAEFLDSVEKTSSGMRHVLQLERGANVGVFSRTRYEWTLVEQSCNRMAYTLVPVYDTFGPTAVPYVINHTEMKVIFCGKDQVPILLACRDECPHLQTIVQYEDVTNIEREEARAKNVELKDLKEIIEAGSKYPVPADPPLPNDICTICYTSGTTGTPKGALLTHANFVSAINAYRPLLNVKSSDVYLSFLPLPHVAERFLHGVMITDGVAIGYYNGDIGTILNDIQTLKPTVFGSVPRLLNRIYDKVNHSIATSGSVKKFLFEQGFAAKQAGLQEGQLTHWLWDPLVFDKVKQVLGGNVRQILTGAAPITQDVKEFFQIVCSVPVMEAYGITEASAAVCCSSADMAPGNHVGAPLPGVQICLEDIPEMSYTSADTPYPRGEILLKGPNIFIGYYKQPDLTSEVLDKEGWYNTGDVGCWREDGTLQIIDRKKNIFKLSQGEHVAPDKIEGVYMKSPYVGQIYVHGESLESYLVAVVVPDPDFAASWAASTGKQTVNLKELCEDEEFKRLILEDMERLAERDQLFGFERVKKLYLTTEAFGVENDLATPSMKIKRPRLAKHFAEEIKALYTA